MTSPEKPPRNAAKVDGETTPPENSMADAKRALLAGSLCDAVAATFKPISGMSLDRVREVELTAIRNEMREWQGRRFQLATIAGAFVSGVLAFLSKSSLKDSAPIRFVSLWVLLLLIALTLYGHFANKMGRAYVAERFPGFLWEDGSFRNLRESRLGIQSLLSIYYFVLSFGFYVAACAGDAKSLSQDCRENGLLVCITGFLILLFWSWICSESGIDWDNRFRPGTAKERDSSQELKRCFKTGVCKSESIFTVLSVVAWLGFAAAWPTVLHQPLEPPSPSAMDQIRQLETSAQRLSDEVLRGQQVRIEQSEKAQKQLSAEVAEVKNAGTLLERRVHDLENPSLRLTPPQPPLPTPSRAAPRPSRAAP